MNSASPSYSSLQELIVSDQISRDKSVKVMSFILKLESPASYGTPAIYMMTRPRGFGLSLLTNATERILKREADILGKIEDEGLLKQIPFRHTLIVDFKKIKGRDPKEFKKSLLDTIQELFWLHHIESHTDPYITPKAYFTRLIEELFKKHQEPMAVLIDNYDQPLNIASMMDSSEMRIESVCIYLDMLNVLKYSDKSVKWCLITGHTKFALASEYSEGLPVISDLTTDPSFESMFGFSKTESGVIFKSKLEKFASDLKVSFNEYLDILERCYGGFCFSDNLVKMICPASISHLIQSNGKLLPYSASGKYSFLRYALKNNRFDDLSWLYGKDGQDPLYADSIDATLSGKQIGSLLIQLGFATRSRVLVNSDEGYTTWRYRYDFPNLDMKMTFNLITGLAPGDMATQELDLTAPLNEEEN